MTILVVDFSFNHDHIKRFAGSMKLMLYSVMSHLNALIGASGKTGFQSNNHFDYYGSKAHLMLVAKPPKKYNFQFKW